MLCNFDIIFSKTIDNEEVNYGIIEGNNTVLFIKAGQDGSMYGYQNKYLTIANNINKNYGYTVICSSNPLRKSTPLRSYQYSATEVVQNCFYEKVLRNIKEDINISHNILLIMQFRSIAIYTF